ncbi:DUF6123 family protein [Aquibacillus kalidii]|uniref:DUF6123 family protein n=1 Tax=Aquibacillus kalidii TaxID=2762597 RepID=UPI001644B1B2|nr:DUF6123 family protein [Aquibacillus kalidii]
MERYKLAYYIEDLWTKGFKLTDEEVRFIYFGKKYTGTSDWKVILAIEVTLKLQMRFVGSFFISVLELLAKETVKNKSAANRLLKKKGVC